jgi:hypothetical protein
MGKSWKKFIEYLLFVTKDVTKIFGFLKGVIS